MSALQTFLLVVDHDKEEAKRIADTVAQGTSDPPIPRTGFPRLTYAIDVESKKTTLIDIVQQLGEYINDEDPIIRGKAVSFLTAVIKALSPRFLTRQQIQVLTTFFGDRIEDGGAVTGLEHLQGLDRFNDELATETAQAYVNRCLMAGRSLMTQQSFWKLPGSTVSLAVTKIPCIPIAE